MTRRYSHPLIHGSRTVYFLMKKYYGSRTVYESVTQMTSDYSRKRKVFIKRNRDDARTRARHSSTRRSRPDDAARASPFDFSVFLSHKQRVVQEARCPARFLLFVYQLRDVVSVPRDEDVRWTRASRSRERYGDDVP